ncbi:hypothetical protein LR48_Vigan05g082100 [Vigna angularis]|uniref:Uncharacterized protein n=1 Tax=Phaseolus angularis TaxID=3914 RepID=A0A0L9UKW8_PHAAN|nr:hypothetical protein LR48_Vigan05g082100 [Vigna angularis]
MLLDSKQLIYCILVINTSCHYWTEIDASYYTQYCMLDEAGIPMPTPQPLRVQRRVPQPDQHGQAQDAAQDVALFQMRDMYMSLMESRMEALYRGEQDPTQDGGGAGASGAAAMEEDEQEEEEEEDEEDDSDDSQG